MAQFLAWFTVSLPTEIIPRVVGLLEPSEGFTYITPIMNSFRSAFGIAYRLAPYLCRAGRIAPNPFERIRRIFHVRFWKDLADAGQAWF